jgi:hypothetical protein
MDMNLLWVNIYMGNINFGADGLDFDRADIVAVGSFAGSIDFGNSFVYTAASSLSPFYIKLNTAGATQAGFALNGGGTFATIRKSINNNFVITGFLSSTTDMDPSAANLPLITTVNSAFTAVYQSPSIIATENKTDRMNIHIYPNPTQESISLSVAESLIGSDYSLYNTVGGLVLQHKISATQTRISLENTNAGIYFLKINNAVFKIVKLKN